MSVDFAVERKTHRHHIKKGGLGEGRAGSVKIVADVECKLVIAAGECMALNQRARAAVVVRDGIGQHFVVGRKDNSQSDRRRPDSGIEHMGGQARHDASLMRRAALVAS
jgi:hypothetical protein